LGHRLNC